MNAPTNHELYARIQQDLFGLKLEDFTNLSDRRNFIRRKLLSNRAWVERAVLAIYELHCADLPSFYAKDVTQLCFIAKQLLSGRQLSDEQLPRIAKQMTHYAHMLELIARTRSAGGLPC